MSSPFDELVSPVTHIQTASPIFTDPFANLEEAALPPPDEDDPLHKWKSDPDLMDLTEQIAETKYLRQRLLDSLERRAELRINNLIREIQESVRNRLIRAVPEATMMVLDQAIYDGIKHHFPGNDLTIQDAEALQKFSMHIGTLAQKYRTIMDGMTVQVQFESEEFDSLMRVLFQVVPLNILLEVSTKLEEVAPKMGERMARKIG